MDYVEPELRENTGEIEAALAHRLPKIIGYGDLAGRSPNADRLD